MRLLTFGVLATSFVFLAQGLFAQARGSAGGVPPAAPPPRAPGPGRVASGRGVTPLAPRAPLAPFAPGFAGAPIYVYGYYPNPFYYGDGSNGYIAPPTDDSAPAPSYYSGDPNAGQSNPSVIFNPNFVPDRANPVMRDYSYLPPADAAQPASAPAEPQVFFLIAMKDHVIYPALAYWVDGDTFNYISQQGVRTQVPLSSIDREFSTQLNKQRNIDFALPDAHETK